MKNLKIDKIMNTLQLNDVAPYFQYVVFVTYNDCITSRKRVARVTLISKTEIETTYNRKISGCNGDTIRWKGHNDVSELNMKLLLRPLESYSTIDEIVDEMTDYEIAMINDNPDMAKRLSYEVIQKMLKHHIDIFGLINKRLAVSIHDIE